MASDERGICVKDRLQYLVDMHNYMMQFYDPSEFPPPSTHIYNLPIQSFEMIMQSISITHCLLPFSTQEHLQQ